MQIAEDPFSSIRGLWGYYRSWGEGQGGGNVPKLAGQSGLYKW